MERILRSRPLLFLLIAIPIILGCIAYFNLRKKGALAEIKTLVGSELTIQPADLPDRVKGALNTRLNSGDHIETGPATTATLEFADGSEIEIAPESRVQIEKDDSLIPPQTTLQILVGQAHATEVGSGRLILITDQQSHEIGAVALPDSGAVHATETGGADAAGASSGSSTTRITTTTTTLSPSNATATAEAPGTDANSLPTDYIESVIRAQRSHISRCFSDLLRKSSKAIGRMDVSFTIEGSGRPVRVHVLGSTLTDPAFQQCITGVFEHLQFRTFQGESIIVNYPLEFN